MDAATDTSTPERTEAPPAAGRGLRWWLRAAEVRLRFVALAAGAALLVAGWGWIRGAWDRLWYSARGDTAAAAVSGDSEYFCPMDPGVVSAWPAVCPICNMDLVLRKKHDAQLLPEGVLARMQFSPYRIQLAGIRTSPVEPRLLQYEVFASGTLTELEGAGYGQGGAGALGFESALSPADVPLLRQARTAVLSLADDPARTVTGVATLVGRGEDSARGGRPAVPRIRVILSEADEAFVAGAAVRATVGVPAAESSGAPDATPESSAAAVLAIPESAVVDHGRERVAFVESMPGTFDAVAVTLGRRCGDHYPVLSGLKPGQRVATAGAFLIDAETRLNPGLAVAYFGANQAGSQDRIPEVRIVARSADAPTLSAEEKETAARQGICPVTGLDLDSMGGPVPVVVEGRTVFICCKGCEGRLKSEPEKYLSKLPAP